MEGLLSTGLPRLVSSNKIHFNKGVLSRYFANIYNTIFGKFVLLTLRVECKKDMFIARTAAKITGLTIVQASGKFVIAF